MTQARFNFAALAGLSLSLFVGCGGDDPDPPDGDKPTIRSFTVLPGEVATGGTVELKWDVANASSITIVATPGGTIIDAEATLTGMRNHTVNADTMFKLTATGADGATAEQTRTVTIDAQALSIVSFEARPNPALINGTTELAWQTTGATSVTVRGGNLTAPYTAPAGSLAMGTLLTPTLTAANYTYTLEASNGDSMVTETVTLTTQ